MNAAHCSPGPERFRLTRLFLAGERPGNRGARYAKKIGVALAIGLSAIGGLQAQESEAVAKHAAPLAADLPVEVAILTHAPDVPPFISRTHPAKVVVNLEVKEVTNGSLGSATHEPFPIAPSFGFSWQAVTW